MAWVWVVWIASPWLRAVGSALVLGVQVRWGQEEIGDGLFLVRSVVENVGEELMGVVVRERWGQMCACVCLCPWLGWVDAGVVGEEWTVVWQVECGGLRRQECGDEVAVVG